MIRDLFSLFPACAGVILIMDISFISEYTFPRMRGGDPAINEVVNGDTDFSPHARG